MCLLAVLSHTVPGAPLMVAANRDELLTRPSVSMTVLNAGSPRILGGRDSVAKGTWLAVNEHGVVAGLTNLPNPSGTDASKKSRGELPLLAAGHTTAESAARTLGRELRAEQYNPCWLLIADRHGVFYLDVTGFGAPGFVGLGRGAWILENRPILSDSPKADSVRLAFSRADGLDGDTWAQGLHDVMKSHEVPERAKRTPASVRPLETEAPCVHAGPYGSRSSMYVRVLAEGLPDVRFTDGPPCTASLVGGNALWKSDGL